jgi:hypothetical protein
MNRQTCAATLMAIVFAVGGGVLAQSQNPPDSTPRAPSAQTPPPAAPSTPAPADENALSVTGCLREAPASSAGAPASTPDAAGKAEAANGQSKFVLENAVPATTQGPASEPHATAAKTYRLIANDAALTPHVGKKLELVGTLEAQDASPRASAESASASSAKAPMLRVRAGKIIAESCTT